MTERERAIDPLPASVHMHNVQVHLGLRVYSFAPDLVAAIGLHNLKERKCVHVCVCVCVQKRFGNATLIVFLACDHK